MKKSTKLGTVIMAGFTLFMNGCAQESKPEEVVYNETERNLHALEKAQNDEIQLIDVDIEALLEERRMYWAEQGVDVNVQIFSEEGDRSSFRETVDED